MTITNFLFACCLQSSAVVSCSPLPWVPSVLNVETLMDRPAASDATMVMNYTGLQTEHVKSNRGIRRATGQALWHTAKVTSTLYWIPRNYALVHLHFESAFTVYWTNNSSAVFIARLDVRWPYGDSVTFTHWITIICAQEERSLHSRSKTRPLSPGVTRPWRRILTNGRMSNKYFRGIATLNCRLKLNVWWVPVTEKDCVALRASVLSQSG